MTAENARNSDFFVRFLHLFDFDLRSLVGKQEKPSLFPTFVLAFNF